MSQASTLATSESPLTEKRPYLRVQPSDERLRPKSVARSLARLHRIDSGGFLEPSTAPTYEFLFVATGESGDTGKRSIEWYVGLDPGSDSGKDDATRQSIAQALRQCLPRSFDITETSFAYADVLPLEDDYADLRGGARPALQSELVSAGKPLRANGDGGVVSSTSTSSEHLPNGGTTKANSETGSTSDSIDGTNDDSPSFGSDTVATETVSAPLADWEVAGVEFEGVGTRPDDWQLPLRALNRFEGETRYDADAEADYGDWPLTTLLDGLATTDAPTLVQLLVRPKPDWTSQARSRELDLESRSDLWRQILAREFGEFIYSLLGGDSSETTGTRDQQRNRDRYAGRGRDEYRHRDAYERTGPSGYDRSVPFGEAERIRELGAVDARRTFTVNARAVAFGSAARTPERTLDAIEHTFDTLGGAHYRIEPRRHSYGAASASGLLERVCRRRIHTDPRRLRHWIPGVRNASRAIIADVNDLGGLCLTDGASLSEPARRALETTPRDRTGIELPSRSVLTPYLDVPGMQVGRPKTADRTPLDTMFTLPPAVQPIHVALFGTTGAGKTSVGQRMQLTNHEATDGATVYLDSKGDGAPELYAMMHFARYGSLDDVYYFECQEYLPVLPFLTIEPLLEAGFAREQAVNDVTDHFIETLAAAGDPERFYAAEAAIEALELVVKAQFDPVHGADSVSQEQLHASLEQFHETGHPPPVSDPDLYGKLQSLGANTRRTFDEIMAGAGRRLGRATRDGRLRPLFSAHHHDDARTFDLREKLDEDCVIIFDMSGYGERARTLLSVVILSQLWRALQQRIREYDHRRRYPSGLTPNGDERELEQKDTIEDGDDAEGGYGAAVEDRRVDETEADGTTAEPSVASSGTDKTRLDPPNDVERGQRHDTNRSDGPPLVNCYIEEAAELATTNLLDTLLSQGRAFNLGITLAMQFPEQIREAHPRVYSELLNDVGTIITGNVGVDRRLAERLSTAEMDADEVAARLRDLERGEWLVRPGAAFGETKPQPFYLASAPLPSGHPDGDVPLTRTRHALFTAALARVKHRTRTEHGVSVAQPASGAGSPVDTTRARARGSERPALGDHSSSDPGASLAKATATIPNSNRFPDCLTYLDEPPFPLVCSVCESRYAATADGMRRAIDCHHSLEDVDRDSIPICSLDLQLTASERTASEYSDAQLRFLAAVYMAHQQRFDPDLEYDITRDSMTLLEAYVGIEKDAVRALVDAGLVSVDCTRPYKLYTVTPTGRDEIGVRHREGIAHGDGTGDLSESSLHVAMVEVGARLLQREFCGPDGPGVEVRRYHDVEGGRLDAAVLDVDGEILVTLEAERINNDRAEAIPADFDKMAACNPEHAWWIVKTRADAHEVLTALNDPPDGEPRVTKTYSEQMAPHRFTIETPGLTEIHTFERARNALYNPTD